MEVQIYRLHAAVCRRPTGSVIAGATQVSETFFIACVAVARGGEAGNGGLADRLDGSDGKVIFVLYECGAFSFQKEKE